MIIDFKVVLMRSFWMNVVLIKKTKTSATTSGIRQQQVSDFCIDSWYETAERLVEYIYCCILTILITIFSTL